MNKQINKDDDFYKKVEHALNSDKIVKENLDSAMAKIDSYLEEKKGEVNE